MTNALAKHENGTTRSDAAKGTALDARWMRPPVDSLENGDAYVVIADVPGVSVDHLTVNFERDELYVEAWPAPCGEDTALRACPLRLDVGDGVDPDGISAELDRGVVRVELRKLAARWGAAFPYGRAESSVGSSWVEKPLLDAPRTG